jgi:hypothetical protein
MAITKITNKIKCKEVKYLIAYSWRIQIILTFHSIVSRRDLKYLSVFVVPFGGCKHFREMYKPEDESRMF